MNVCTREPQCIARNVDADRARRIRAEQLEQVSGAGTTSSSTPIGASASSLTMIESTALDAAMRDSAGT